MKLSIIIPVFNEEKTITEIIKRVHSVDIPKVQKEIIVINDGSTDKTQERIRNILKEKKNIKYVQHKKNKGKGAAVLSGIKKMSGDYIIIQDADLEYHPKYFKNLLAPVQNGTAKVVYGTRLNRLPNLKKEEKHNLFIIHYFGNRFLSLITSILYSSWITDMETGYKLFPKEALRDIKLNAKGFEFEPEITSKLLKKGYKIKEVSITVDPRGYKEGKKLNALKDGSKALWTLIKYRFID